LVLDKVASGNHTLKLTHDQSKNWSKPVTITGGAKTVVYAYLEGGPGNSTVRDETITADSTGTYGTLEVHSWGDCSIYVDDEFGGITDHWNGNAVVSGLLPGTYTVKLTHAENKAWVKQVTIESSQKTVFYAYLESGAGSGAIRNETITPNSINQYGTLEVHSWGDCSIFVDNEFGGTTDHWNGSATVSGLLPGTYTVKLTHAENKAWTKQVKIDTSQKTVVYAYLENGAGTGVSRSETITADSVNQYGTLEVHSSGDCGIYIDNEFGGTTDHWNGTATVSGLLPGTYTVKLTHSENKAWIKKVTVETSQKTVFYAYLESGSGTGAVRNETLTPDSVNTFGTLEVHSWGDCSIFVSGEFGGTTDHWNGTATVSGLLPGTYTVKLTHAENKAWTKKVTIETSQKTVVYAYLESGAGTGASRSEVITPESVNQYGTLEVHSQGDVNIFIDNEYGGGTDHWNGTATVSGLLPGTYTVRLKLEGHIDWVGEITIESGQKFVLEASLDQQ
jgi:uncharacterized membrane protein YvbJ